MVLVSRLLHRVGPLRVGIGAVLALGLLLAAGYAVGAASPHGGLPFAIGAAQLPRATPTSSAPSVTPPAIADQRGAVAPASSGSAGCGGANAIPAGTTDAQTLRAGQMSRSYRLHVPRGYQGDVPTPLVLAFHGHGGSAAPFERFTHLSQLADARTFIAVYPQGTVGPDGQTGWNTGRARDPRVDDVGFVRDLLAHTQATLCVDTGRIYATGFSNGGGFVAVLACDLADRFAAFAPVAGDYYPQPGGCHPARPVSLLEIHGTADGINPYDGSTQLHYPPVATWLADWAARDGCAAPPTLQQDNLGVLVEIWTGCENSTTVVHDRLIGAGHIWPVAGSGSLGRSETFDADDAIWGFFRTNEQPALAG